jgi:hypothetical protein
VYIFLNKVSIEIKKKKIRANASKCQRLMPIILATQKVEIRRTSILSHPGQTVLKTLSQKYSTKKRAGRGSSGRAPAWQS